MALLGWWKFDETSGTSFADSSGNGRTLTSTGTVTAGSSAIASAGPKAVDLAGGYLYHAGDTDLRSATTWTVGAWVNFDTLVNNAHVLGMEYSGGRINFGLIHNRDNSWGNGKFGIGFYDGNWRECYYNTALSASTTYFLCGTYDGTTMRFYIDGSEVATSTPGGSNAASTGQLFLGRLWDSDNNHQDGRFDEAFVCSDVLTAGQIASIYADTSYLASIYSTRYDSAVSASGPKLFFKLDEPSGSTAFDSGSLGINGTYSGSPTLAQSPLAVGSSAAARFASGDSAYVSVPTSAPSAWDAFTVAGWWKATDQTTDPFLMMMGWGGGSSIPIGLGYNSGGSTFVAGTFSGSSWTTISGTTSIVAGRTYFVAATLTSKSSGTLTLYVNGASEGTASPGSVGSWTQSTVYIGHQWDSGNMSTGTYDGWAMWDRVLNSTEIANLYAAGLADRQKLPPVATRRSVTVQQRSRRF